jgi:hypothetical protein
MMPHTARKDVSPAQKPDGVLCCNVPSMPGHENIRGGVIMKVKMPRQFHVEIALIGRCGL